MPLLTKLSIRLLHRRRADVDRVWHEATRPEDWAAVRRVTSTSQAAERLAAVARIHALARSMR